MLFNFNSPSLSLNITREYSALYIVHVIHDNLKIQMRAILSNNSFLRYNKLVKYLARYSFKGRAYFINKPLRLRNIPWSKYDIAEEEN